VNVKVKRTQSGDAFVEGRRVRLLAAKEHTINIIDRERQ